MLGRNLGPALRAGQRVYGTCVTSTAPGWPAMIASAGSDFVFIDTEHTPIGRETLAWMCRSYAALGMAPLVRIPEPDPYRACMVLDGGASGVIAPYVETVEQVQQLRGAVKYRPLKGARLQRFLAYEEELEEELRDYVETRNADRVLIINIESVPALNNLDDLLTVPGVDALLVGPHDLSLNLGIPEQYTHPKFQEAITTIIKKARANHVGVGIHYSEGMDLQLQWARQGANFIVHSSDVSMVQQTLSADLTRFRDEMGDSPGEGAGEGAII